MPNTRLEFGTDRIATLRLDTPGKRVNTLSRQMWSELSTAIDDVAQAQPIALIITSNKPSNFVAGADLFEIRDMSDEALDDYILTGQRILQRLESLTVKTIAAINGDCLGGGLELAMACRVRIAADDPAIRIGLPETGLGLMPGWGGTLRMRKLVGLEEAITLAALGETIDPQRAMRVGLVDAIVPVEELLAAARSSPAEKPQKHDDIDTRRIFGWAEQKIRQNRSGDQAIAPIRVLEAIRDGVMHGEAKGLEAERKGLVELRRSPGSQKLMQTFFDRHEAKSHQAAV